MGSLRMFVWRFIVLAGLPSALVLLLPTKATADLIGDSVSCTVIAGPLICSPATATVVDPGIEFSADIPGFHVFDIDVSASSILLRSSFGGFGTPNSLTIGDLDWIGMPGAVITGVSLSTSVGVTGLDASDITFTARSVTVNYAGSGFEPPNATATISLQVSQPVPDAPTLVLVGAGVAGVGAFVWRRRRP